MAEYLSLDANEEKPMSSDVAGRRGLISSELNTDDEFDFDLDFEFVFDFDLDLDLLS